MIMKKKKPQFGQGLDNITDMEVGPDGFLYVLSYSKDQANIFRIVPQNTHVA
jgi:hypothetical protein